MNFFKPKNTPATAASSSPPFVFPNQAFVSLQTHFTNFFQNWQTNPLFQNPLFAKIGNENNAFPGKFTAISSNGLTPRNYGMSPEAIEERLAGVPVYAPSSVNAEFVYVSNAEKSLGLFFLGEADAEKMLEQMKSVNPSLATNSQVVPVALSKLVNIKVDGMAVRFIPEVSQIKNAVEERERAGISGESFPGVPVFQSKTLVMRSKDKTYRPVFFRKEDLERSLLRASRDQNQLNPRFRQGNVQVAVLEDIIQAMKDGSESSWNDVVFVPPGIDVETDPSQLNKGKKG